jgi:hypothetical protein
MLCHVGEEKNQRERVKDASSSFQGLGSAFTQIPNKERQSVHLEAGAQKL